MQILLIPFLKTSPTPVPISLFLTWTRYNTLYNTLTFKSLKISSKVWKLLIKWLLYLQIPIHIVIENSRGCFKIYGKSIKCKNKQIKPLNINILEICKGFKLWILLSENDIQELITIWWFCFSLNFQVYRKELSRELSKRKTNIDIL